MVDERIGQIQQKKDLLEQYKKGMMQRLFSQTLRFTDTGGTPFPDWEEKRIDEIGKTYNGLTGKSANDFGMGEPFITYKQVFDSSFIKKSNYGFVQITSADNQNKVSHGDILFTTSSETTHEVGFASVFLGQNENVYLNSFCFGLRPHNIDNLNPNFSRYLFRSAEYRAKVLPLAQGSTRYNISKTSFIKIKLQIPHPDEQKKIADFLSAIDDKIVLVSDELTHAKTFKKGLLQQMFV